MSSNPPTLAFDLERDIRILSAMASNLTPYLYEQDMYGYLGGDMPKLTLGGLLMRLYRLSHLEARLNTEQRNAVQDARVNFEAECSKWAVHYKNKLQHELKSRADALILFFDECGEDLASCAASYPSQAEKRIMIEHLRSEADRHNVLADELDDLVKHADQRFRRRLHEGPFITDGRLESVYPRAQFWWMYGYIAEK
jgi:hypothetical protein